MTNLISCLYVKGLKTLHKGCFVREPLHLCACDSLCWR